MPEGDNIESIHRQAIEWLDAVRDSETVDLEAFFAWLAASPLHPQELFTADGMEEGLKRLREEGRQLGEEERRLVEEELIARAKSSP